MLMLVVIGLWKLKNALVLRDDRSYDYVKKISSSRKKLIHHIVIINCYKESIVVIATTVQALADQTEAQRIIMVIGFEERTPDKEEKW